MIELGVMHTLRACPSIISPMCVPGSLGPAGNYVTMVFLVTELSDPSGCSSGSVNLNTWTHWRYDTDRNTEPEDTR